MKKHMKTVIGLIMSVMIIFAFAGCGEKADPAADASAALDQLLSALKSADMNAIQEISGGEDTFKDAAESLGSEDGVQSVLTSMFGHFDYKIGEAEVVDDTHVNVHVNVTNADMEKAVEKWFSDLMAFAMSNPDAASDEETLHKKTIEMLQTSVDAVAEEENGTVSKDVTFPMVYEDGKWDVSSDIDDSVLDAVMGGFMTAISKLQPQQ